MAPWLTLLLAFALGWLIGFLIDWWYWRRRGSQMQASLEACQADAAKLRTDLDGTRKQVNTLTTDLQSARADNDNLRLQLTKSGPGLVAPTLAAAGGAVLGAAAAGADEDVEKYKQQIADLEAKVDMLQNDLNATRDDRWRIRGEVVEGESDEATLRAENTRLQALLAAGAGAAVGAAASGEDVEKYKRQIADLEAQLNGCHADLEASRLQVSRLESDVKKLGVVGATAAGVATVQTLKSDEPKTADVQGFAAGTPPTTLGVAAGAAVGAAAAAAAGAAKGDDLEIIEGIGPRIADLLRANDITTFAQLAATPQSELRAILDKGGPAFNRADPETWPEQAALAAKGDWDGLKKLQAQLIGGRRLKADDLTIVEGIGPKIAELLRANGITTFRQLAATDPTQLKAILAKGGPAFNYADPTTWPEQADLLARGETARFNALTVELIAGRRRGEDLGTLQGVSPALAAALSARGIKSYKQLAETDRATLESLLAESGGASGGLDYDTLSEQATLAAAGDWDVLKDYQDRLKAEAAAAPDDLIVIEGIGPKIAEVLNAAGIRTYWRLWHTTPLTLRRTLDAAGPQYRIADPTTWPEQAALLAKGDRPAFDALVARLVGGRERGAAAPVAAAPAATARAADDLGQIRGIGPSIAKALNAAGITTYEDLAAQTPERLREIVTPISGPNVEVNVWIIRARELASDPGRRQSS